MISVEARPQAFQNSRQEVFGKTQQEVEMQHLRRLQWEFNTRLKLPDNPEDTLNRSFNPVTDRWHVEMLRKKGDEDGLAGFRQEMRLNHKTDLMERYNASESYGVLLIKDGNLYSPEFPEMPLGEVLKRGADYRKELGSPEPEREGELGEVGGWEIINREFANPNAQVGDAYLSLSPKSMVSDGAYTGKFVDKFELALDTSGNRQVKRARYAVSWNDSEYKNAALSIDPDYFKNYDGRPLDAWFLSHPLKTNKEVSPISSNGLPIEKFDLIYEDPLTQRLISHYENLIHAPTVDWLEVALAVNAVRNHADGLKRRIAANEDMSIIQGADFDERKFLAYIYEKGSKKAESVGGGGCPENKGVDLAGLLGGSGRSVGFEIFSNSVAKFLKGEQEWFSCPKCGFKADGPIGGGGCPNCHITQEEALEQGYIEAVCE